MQHLNCHTTIYKHTCGGHEGKTGLASSSRLQLTSQPSCGLANNLTLFHCHSGA
jgi:hypothetical protein